MFSDFHNLFNAKYYIANDIKNCIYLFRSVFGGTVGPNPMKPSNPNDPQYYEGIKVRDIPLIINIQTTPVPKTTTNTTATKGQQARRKSIQSVVVSPAKSPPCSTALSVVADSNATEGTAMSPASPILKAQLSAPPKQRETVVTSTPTTVIIKGDAKSQVITVPVISFSGGYSAGCRIAPD